MPVVTNYIWDVFIIYSEELEDRRWVHKTLAKTMEETYHLKVCIHLRDFILGEDILDNAELALRRSRKVVAVVSPNFAQCGWCDDELQMTRTLEREEGTHKLITILLKDFDSIAANIPPAVRLVLSNSIIWKEGKREEKSFWKSLISALYA